VRRAAERLRAAVQDEAWAPIAAFDRGLTVSIGVALAGPGDDLDRTLQRADEALYRAKRDGLNQVQVSLRVPDRVPWDRGQGMSGRSDEST
jgi:GGDEF domain-containing protein